MSFIDKFRPAFWNYEDVAAGSHSDLFNFRQKWWRMVILTSIVALTPLIILSVLEYRTTRKEMKEEAIYHTNRMVASRWRALSFFINKHRSVMAFVLIDNTKEALLIKSRLDKILTHLNQGGGSFADLAIISEKGRLLQHAGPFSPRKGDYCEEACFKGVINRGFFIGGLIPDRRPNQHLAMALRKDDPAGGFYVLRATVNIQPFADLLGEADLLADVDLGRKGDAFIINTAGILQTPSRRYGQPHDKLPLPVPRVTQQPQVLQSVDKNGANLIVGFAAIPDTSLILMVAYEEKVLMSGWRRSRIKMFVFLGISVTAILLTVLGMATYLVNRIHAADQKRIIELHKVEYANKMASLGRLSAGVGHEINNPIAIANEKIGLIRDLLLQLEDNPFGQKMIHLTDDIIESMKRCGNITNRLINFGRYQDIRIEPLDLKRILHDLLAFVENEAESLCIDVLINAPENLPLVESDKNSLQQIFLNIINNAFAAMANGGRLAITVENPVDQTIGITFADTGRGIAPEDIKRVFEPFFSSKSSAAGTGLGLSVTYGLINKIGGAIRVESELGKGARFVVELPLKAPDNLQKDDCVYHPPDE